MAQAVLSAATKQRVFSYLDQGEAPRVIASKLRIPEDLVVKSRGEWKKDQSRSSAAKRRRELGLPHPESVPSSGGYPHYAEDTRKYVAGLLDAQVATVEECAVLLGITMDSVGEWWRKYTLLKGDTAPKKPEPKPEPVLDPRAAAIHAAEREKQEAAMVERANMEARRVKAKSLGLPIIEDLPIGATKANGEIRRRWPEDMSARIFALMDSGALATQREAVELLGCSQAQVSLWYRTGREAARAAAEPPAPPPVPVQPIAAAAEPVPPSPPTPVSVPAAAAPAPIAHVNGSHPPAVAPPQRRKLIKRTISLCPNCGCELED